MRLLHFGSQNHLNPRAFVELGTHGGFSYFAFCQAVQKLGLNSKCYAVDTWQGDEHSGHYDDEIFVRVKTYNEEHYSAFSSLVRSTFDEAKSHFSDGTVDLLHIDGRHFYEDVEHDFKSWRPKLSDEAVVLFHDTNVRERNFGVFKLWEKLSHSYPSFEFIHGYGLGVLAVGKNVPVLLDNLFTATKSKDALVSVRTSYARLGSAVKIDAINFLQHHDIQHKTQELKRLQTIVEENGRLRQQLETSSGENDRLVQQHLASQDEIRRLVADLTSIGEVVKILKNDVAVREKEIEAQRNSPSWKVTAPLRSLGRALARGRRKSNG